MNRIQKILFATLFLSLGFSVSAQSLKPNHQAVGKNCQVCHTQENAVAGNAFVRPDDKACLACHGSYEAAAKRTEGKPNGEPNPHASAHYGSGIACTACHSEHKPSTVYCNNCHEFKYSNIK